MPEHFKDETGLTRRTIMRTAAWSVPVIAAAVATPMAAASETLTITGTGYVGETPFREIWVTAKTSAPVNLDPAYFSVSGTPEVTVTGVTKHPAANFFVMLNLDKGIEENTGRILTITIPGFTPESVSLH